MDPIDAAIADLKFLKLVGKGKIQEIATKHDVNQSTLLNGRGASRVLGRRCMRTSDFSMINKRKLL
jgi:hypothetical protein